MCNLGGCDRKSFYQLFFLFSGQFAALYGYVWHDNLL